MIKIVATDGVITCEFCGVFRGQHVSFNQLLGRTGLLGHLLDHEAAGDRPRKFVIEQFADLWEMDPFGERPLKGIS